MWNEQNTIGIIEQVAEMKVERARAIAEIAKLNGQFERRLWCKALDSKLSAIPHTKPAARAAGFVCGMTGLPPSVMILKGGGLNLQRNANPTSWDLLF